MTGREQAIEVIAEKIELGVRLTESEVRDYLYLTRDYTLMSMARLTLADEEIDKSRVRVFNALQNAVERHEITHPDRSNNEDGKIMWSIFETDAGSIAYSPIEPDDPN